MGGTERMGRGRMITSILIGIIGFAVFAITGCTPDITTTTPVNTSTSTATQTEGIALTVTPVATPGTPLAVALSGSGKSASPPLELNQGLTRAVYSYEGTGNFIARLLDHE